MNTADSKALFGYMMAVTIVLLGLLIFLISESVPSSQPANNAGTVQLPEAPSVEKPEEKPATVGNREGDQVPLKPSEASIAPPAPKTDSELSPVTPLLLCLVLVLGALGAQIQALLSLADYVGNKAYDPSWNFYYLKRPLVGAVVALLLFSALSGGILKGEGASVAIQGFWGMASICLLAGLFSRQAMDKMGQVFGVLFATDTSRKDPLHPATTLTLTALTPNSVVHNTAPQITLTGTGFDATTQVLTNGVPKACTLVSPTQLTVFLSAADIPARGVMNIAVQAGATKTPALPLTLI